MDIKLTFGQKIRNLREDADLSQKALGEAIGATQRRISYIERGIYEPSLEDLRAFCRFFGVSADYLLGLEESIKG